MTYIHVGVEVQTKSFRVQVSFIALKIKRIKWNSASPHIPLISQSPPVVRADRERCELVIAEILVYCLDQLQNQG
jgi:hypothetical protein